MKVIGILSWYDESPQWLAAAVTSFAPAIDHLVAVDGSYLLYPSSMAHPNSPIEQSQAILEAAASVNLPVTLHRRNEPFYGNEVEKRNFTFELAKTVATEDDYFLVFDADEVIHSLAGDFKQQLQDSDCLVAEYGVYNWTTHLQDVHDQFGVNTIHEKNGVTAVRGIYKNIDRLQYVNAHYVVAGYIENCPIFLWGNSNIHEPYADAEDLTHYLKVRHRNADREINRKQAAREYYTQRDKLNIEAVGMTWVEGVDGIWREVGVV